MKYVKNLKKPAFWVIVTSVAVCAAVAVCLMIACFRTAKEHRKTDEAETKELISSLSPEQCAEKLSELGVSVPQELSGINIKELIASIEADPSYHPVVNYTVAYDFYEEVRRAVIRYHGWSDTEPEQ